MISRRDTVLGGLLTIGWTAAPCVCQAQAPRTTRRFGCMLGHDEAEPFFATSTEHQLFVTGNEEVIAKSGDREFDFALAQTLSRLAETFQVLPGFAYFDDFEKPNAYATNRKRMDRADGTVLFGLNYLKRWLAQPESPDAAVAGVCAHEFGHIVQYKYGLDKVLNAGQPTVKRVELHADFLAGYFAGTRKLQKPDYPAAVIAAQKYAGGNFLVNDRLHHGTPDERANAVVRGFEVAYRERRRFAEAIQIGMNYVSVL
jgi:hypothetical protein